jgi:predicted metal-dependent enzyme (double-stranded beta helix superfamily)/rhodanese-related sulfurtransferase
MTLHVPDLAAVPRLQHFVQGMTELLQTTQVEAEILSRGKALLQTLVAQDDWLPEAFAQANPERYQQFLLYADPQDRFSVVSFVWGPGQSTPIHDHTVWGLIGMLRGQENSQPYAKQADGTWAAQGEATLLSPGDVEAVSPTIGDVHLVSNAVADRASISIHVYGANIGKVRRHVFHADGTVKEFVSGYSNPPLKSLSPTGASPADASPSAASPSATTSNTPEHAMPATPGSDEFPVMPFAQVREALLARQEICILDVREEDPFAQAHPLFAANMPLGRVEVDAWWRIPRLDTSIVVYDNGEGFALRAARTLKRMGYTHVHLLAGGLQGWRDAGGEVFRDVNVPSKSFGELVESKRHTPSLSAQEVKALIDQQADVVVLDARRFDEYQTMSIPTGVSVPGAELVLRARALAPKPSTRIIVNCAGRTRSIIGTQSLINAGLPNPVSALRNGTIGWTLAGQALTKGAAKRFPDVDAATREKAALSARAVAYRAGVQRVKLPELRQWLEDTSRTTYFFDVRTPEEYAAGHVSGARSAPGGQLVQETDHNAAVRGARLVLCDNDGTRANMSASWLAQMGWEVHVLDGLTEADFSDTTAPSHKDPDPVGPVKAVKPEQLKPWLTDRNSHTVVLDFSTSAQFVKAHIPNAWWVLRTQLAEGLKAAHKGNRYVLTCPDGRVSRHAVADVQALVKPGVEVVWLEGGHQAWLAAGHKLQEGDRQIGCERIDRYRRPYEGTDNPVEAMQGYLDWEFGLVEQLGRDGTHHFRVI